VRGCRENVEVAHDRADLDRSGETMENRFSMARSPEHAMLSMRADDVDVGKFVSFISAFPHGRSP